MEQKITVIILCLLMASSASARNKDVFIGDILALFSSVEKNQEVQDVLLEKKKAVLNDSKLPNGTSLQSFRMLGEMSDWLTQAEQRNLSLAVSLEIAGYAEKSDLPAVRRQIWRLCNLTSMLEEDYRSDKRFIDAMKKERPELVTEIDMFRQQHKKMTMAGAFVCSTFS